MPKDVSVEISRKLREAEAYSSMGLIAESLKLYEEILSGIAGQNPQKMQFIKNKISKLKEKLKAGQDQVHPRASTANLSVMKQTLAIGEGPDDIHFMANALKELGFFKEAVAEYEKLLVPSHGYPIEKLMPDFLICLLKLVSPPEAINKIESAIASQTLANDIKVRVRSHLGLEMERINQSRLAVDIYKRILEIDPSNRQICKRLQAFDLGRSASSKYDYLIKKGILTSAQLKKALAIANNTNRSIEYALVDSLHINKKEVGRSLSEFYGYPFKGFDPKLPVPVELISRLKKSFLLHNKWVPLSWDKSGVEILIDNPKDLRKTDHIEALLKTRRIRYVVGIKEDIEKFIGTFFVEKRTEAAADKLAKDLEMIMDISFEEEEEIEEEYEKFNESSSQIVRLVDQIIVNAYRRNVSDIHIEPSALSKRTDIRYRIDGVCQKYLQVPNSMSSGILSRIKIMGNLDIAERRLPQDGKIRFKRKGIPEIELRVATLPTTGGFEDVVLRILAKSGAMKIDEMGLTPRNLQIIQTIISQPYGLVLVVGPTGSGKTTTLHSALAYINKPGIKIWTAEDPVEITQAGLRQVEVKPKIGLDFARVMRAFLRSDPDVIMIGEMRDLETASTGIEASLTGHLVLSTLHTNSAPETITRLLDMGLNPLNFSDAFLGVLAQRLVRRLCRACRKAYHPTPEEFEDIVNDYGRKCFKASGIEYTPDFTLYRPVGCDQCSVAGYKGRLGIHELMHGTPEIKRMIKKEATSEELFEKAIQQGMTTLKQDGINKVFQGLTDMNEIRRVCIE